MKIGIISGDQWLRRWSNYGTLFQNYALQTFLRRQGHETFWILTRGEPSSKKRWQRLVSLAKKNPSQAFREVVQRGVGALNPHFVERLETAKIEAFNARHPRHFEDFFERNVPHTERQFSETELFENPPEADAYIVGSDQVWTGVCATLFLGFGGENVRRISYAASGAWRACDERWIKGAAEFLPAFDAVSVREPEGVVLCRKAGRADVCHVADPTLLLTREDWLNLVRAEGKFALFPRKTVLAYFVNVKSRKQLPWNELLAFARERDADLKIVPLQGSELAIPENFVFTPSPAEWLNAYAQADCVLTNSFHGTVFAILMRKPFLVVTQNGKTATENGRFYSILGKLGLESRIFNREIGGGVWRSKCSSPSIGTRFQSVSPRFAKNPRNFSWTRSHHDNRRSRQRFSREHRDVIFSQI